MSAPEEKRIKDAFDTVKMPQGLKEYTLKMIEMKALEQNDSGFFVINVVSPTSNAVKNATDKASDCAATSSSSATIKRQPSKPFARKIAFALAACMLLCAMGFGSFSAYATETAVVGIEMNPSIELGVNRFGTVIATRALNEDGECILKNLSFIGKSSDEAFLLLIQNDVFLSFIDDESFVDIYVVCEDDRQSSELVTQGRRAVSTLPCEGVSGRVNQQTQQKAFENGMGISRYEAALTLISLDPTFTIEDCRSMSMKELRLLVSELDPENEHALNQGAPGNGQQDGSLNGHGSGSGNGPHAQDVGSGSGQGQPKGSGWRG